MSETKPNVDQEPDIDPERLQYESQGGVGTATDELAQTTVVKPPVETFSASEATVRALEMTIDALEFSNTRMQAQLDAEWKWAKSIVVTASVIVALVFGTNVYREFVAVSELRERSSQLAVQLTESKTTSQDLRDEVAALRSKYKEAIKNAKTAQASGTFVTETTLRILSLVDFAQDQLIQRHNPQRAQSHLVEADQVLRNARDRLAKTDGQWKAILDRLSVIVATVRAECAWRLGDVDELQSLIEDALGLSVRG